jgi:hypothetical protein
MKKALIVLSLLITSSGLKAEESLLPFKVGDVVRFSEPVYDSKADQYELVVRVKETKGKWVKTEIGPWFNSDLCIFIEVNNPEDVREMSFIYPEEKVVSEKTVETNTVNTYGRRRPIPPPVHTKNTNSCGFMVRYKPKAEPLSAEQNSKKDARPVGEEAK